MKLFLFPFAGGSAYSYRGIERFLAPGISVVPLEPPGRGKRLDEPCLDSLDLMIDDLLRVIAKSLDGPFAFFGHSMGASLAHLLARRLMANALPVPRWLFISGREAPSVKKPEVPIYTLPREEFFKELRELGGCPPEILDHPELMEFYEPILKSDFKAVETHAHLQGPRLNVPITVMIADQDDVSMEEARLWQQETSKELSVVCFPGDHFFIFRHWREIGKAISSSLLGTRVFPAAAPWMK